MACMEHSCANPNCNEMQFNNSPVADTPCPKCGGRLFHGVFDEEGRSTGARWVNVHKCTKCSKEHYNGREVMYKPCSHCGNEEFDSLIEDALGPIKTKSQA